MTDDLPVPVQPALPDFTVDRIATASEEECLAALRIAGPYLAGLREKVGLLLWRYRAVTSEGLYAAERNRLAEQVGVTPDTLTRWRRKAEEANGLGSPSRRTTAQRALARGARYSAPEPPPPLTSAKQVAAARMDAPPPVPPPPAPRKASAPPAKPCSRCGGSGQEPPPPRLVPDRVTPDPADCPHPVGMRLAGQCTICSARVGKGR